MSNYKNIIDAIETSFKEGVEDTLEKQCYEYIMVFKIYEFCGKTPREIGYQYFKTH